MLLTATPPPRSRLRITETKEFGPACQCGHRGTRRLGYSEDPALNSDTSALVRFCRYCKKTFLYRIHDGRLVPYVELTAYAIDDERRAS